MIRRGRSISAAALALVVGLVVATPTVAESGRLVDFRLGFTRTSPSAPTGMSIHVLFRAADDPNAKPSPIRSVLVRTPDGARFDPAAVPQCAASDDELRALGPNACPSDTALTVGSFTAMTGFGPPFDPFVGDDHVFNGPSQLIEVITVHGSSASPGFDRLTIDGSTLRGHPPASPGGPPDGETAVRSIDFQIPARVAGARSLITTPPACPDGGEWTSSGTFEFANGGSDTVVSETPCAGRQVPRRVSAVALRLSVRPHRVVVGRAVGLRLHVRSNDASCLRRVRLRLDGRTYRANGRGRAIVTTRFWRAGRHYARASSPGCRSARAAIEVIAAHRR